MKRGYFLLSLAMLVASTSIIMSLNEPVEASMEYAIMSHAKPVEVPYLDMTINEVKERQNGRQSGVPAGAEPDVADEYIPDAAGYQGEPEEDREDLAGAEETAEPDGDAADPVLTYVGNWTITFYCPGPCCCGEWATGCTASGVAATAWHTVATDQFPFGTELYIEGLGYFVVEDLGVSGEWLDVFVNDHQQALDLGMQTREVYLVG